MVGGFENRAARMATVLLLGAWIIVICGRAAAGTTCRDFVVSPQPVVFTAHPSSQSRATVQGDTILLTCTASVQQCGGFQIPITHSTSTKQPWWNYRICWLHQSLSKTYATERCATSDNWNILSSAVGNTKLASTLTIRNASTSSSGSYSCFVDDWRTRYSSYPALVDLESDTAPMIANMVSSSSSTVHLNTTDPTSKVTLKCPATLCPTQYEWYINGSLSTNNTESTIEADSIQSFVCYTHSAYYRSVLTAVYRVLPYGCLNPVVGLEYPTVDVRVHNTSHFTAKVQLCWSQPDHLGGLDSSEIGYHVQFEGLSSGDFPLANVLSRNSKVCFEKQFTSMADMTTRVNIKVTAVPKVDGLTEASLATQFPKTALYGWRKLAFSDYKCGEDGMQLKITDPLRQMSISPPVYWYAGFHLCSRDTTINEEFLREEGALFEYAFTKYGLFRNLHLKFIFFSESSVSTSLSLLSRGQKSCALMVYVFYRDPKLFDSHLGISDYFICTFKTE